MVRYWKGAIIQWFHQSSSSWNPGRRRPPRDTFFGSRPLGLNISLALIMWPLSYLCKQEPQPYCHGLVSHRGRARRCDMQLFACSCDWCFKIFPIVGHITQYSKPVWSIIISKHWAIGLSHYTANCWIRTEGAREISSGCKAKISYLWASTLKVFLKFSSCRIQWTSTNWYSLLLKWQKRSL